MGQVEGPAPVDRGDVSIERPAFQGDHSTLPFETEPLALSDALGVALEENLNLRATVVNTELSEANVLAAQGVFDVVITAGANASRSESTQRGSAFTFSTGSRTLGGYMGVGRKLETGGRVDLRLDLTRSLTEQPVNFFNIAQGTSLLASYNIQPTLTISHPLLKGLGVKVNRAQIDQAKLATSQAMATEQQTGQDLVRDIVSAYWDVLFAQRDLQNKKQSVELAEKQLERTKAQIAAGRLSKVDGKSVEQALATRESEVLLAENALLDTSVSLRALLGQRFVDRDVLGVTPTTDPKDIAPDPVDYRSELKKALKNNPSIRQLELALASRRIDELVAANNRLPQLNFTGSFSPQGRSVDSAANPQQGIEGERGSWGEAFTNFFNEDVGQDGLFAEYTVSGQLDLTWSVQNRAAKGQYNQVQVQVEQAQINLETTQQNVATGVIRAVNGLRTAQKRMEVAEVSVELAETNLEAEEARFEVGRSTNYDVLQRIDELTQAQAQALSAQIDYLKARSTLQALTGEILPAYGLDLAISGR